MNYIVVAGYVCSGSSIINDLLKEVDGYKTFDYEFKIFREADGLLDLESQLIGDWDYAKSAKAINRYLELCRKFCSKSEGPYSYQASFNNRFMDITSKFLDELVDYNYFLGSSMFSLEKDTIKAIDYKGYSFEITKWKGAIESIPFSSIDEKKWYSSVRKYIDSIFEKYNGKYNTIVLDQGFAPHSLSRFNNYFPDGKMIIVDRNPLDLAISMMQRKKGIGPELKRNLDANKYVSWYLKNREYIKKVIDEHGLPSNVMMFTYEDFIYNYDKCKEELFDFLNIDDNDHLEKFKYFNPRESVKRIDKWKKWEHNDLFSEDEWSGFCEEVNKRIEYRY